MLVVTWRLGTFIVPSFVNGYNKLQEPTREFAELDNLTEVTGQIVEVHCEDTQGVRSIYLDTGYSYDLVPGNDFFCEKSQQQWIGKHTRLLTFNNGSSIDVYEFYVGTQRVYDILWFKSKMRNNDASSIAIPISILIGLAFSFWLKRRKDSHMLNYNK